MSRWTPCKRRVFIRRLRQLGFNGPFSGSRHQFMVYRDHRLAVPSNAEFSVAQLRLIPWSGRHSGTTHHARRVVGVVGTSP